MTGIELTNYIGRQGLLTLDKWRIPVEVTDAKRAYGHLRFQVSPLHMGQLHAGLGRDWVASERVQLMPEGGK